MTKNGKSIFVAQGCSWAGKITHRNKKIVSCGHQHTSLKEAEKCVKKMRKERPGNCQDYRVFSIFYVAFVQV